MKRDCRFLLDDFNRLDEWRQEAILRSLLKKILRRGLIHGNPNPPAAAEKPKLRVVRRA